MRGRNPKDRGSALILVLGVLVLLSIIGTAFVVLMRIETRATRNFSDEAEIRGLALQVLSYALAHPTWSDTIDPSVRPYEVDNDNDSANRADGHWFTYPLADLATDTHFRWSFLKKNFGARLNINQNSFYNPNAANTDAFQALNDGSSPGEIAMATSIGAYLDYLIVTVGVFPGANVADSPAIAKEIALRICNYRYGQNIGSPPIPPLPPGIPVSNWPGADVIDDDDFLDRSDWSGNVGAAPNQRDTEDDAAWVFPNWRVDPKFDWTDQDGDGLADEGGEEIDEPDEFMQFPPDPLSLGPLWTVTDDQPFGSADLDTIVLENTVDEPGPPIKAIVNDVFRNWAPGQGYPGYGIPGMNYFSLFAKLFTTYSRDFVGDQTPLGHLNLLPTTLAPADAGYQAEVDIVTADRNKFLAAMRNVFIEGGMDASAADNAAWQVLANIIDYLDGPAEDPDETLTVLVKSEGWSALTDDADLDGAPSPGENNTLTFRGTERQPYFNEFWIYNRGNDRFDNDGDGVVDNDPASVPPDPPPQEVDRNAYFIELTNHYATAITLYNNPALATDPTMDWYIWNETSGTTHSISAGQYWNAGVWAPIAGSTSIDVQAGGYLIIQSRDYSVSDNPQLTLAGLKNLPTGASIPANADIIDLNMAAGSVLFDPGDTVSLVYRYDPDGTGPDPAVLAVIDRQEIPTDMLTHELGNAVPGSRDFAPSWERMDPRLARSPDFDATTIGMPAGTILDLVPTWNYNNAESGVPGSGGDSVRNTFGAVNDADDADADPFDGNYILGSTTHLSLPYIVARNKARYDDLVEIPNDPTYKFPNVGALGNILVVGPMAPDPTLEHWGATEWLVENSPYTSVEDSAEPNPLDVKKIDFTSDNTLSSADNPKGRAKSVFDIFTTFCPWKDGKDNDGDWDIATDDLDGDLGPSPGDLHVDESDEVYVYGRLSINGADEYVLSALPYVKFNDATFYRGGGPPDVSRVFLPATDDVVTVPNIPGIYETRGSALFESRRNFLARVILPALDLPNANYNPAASTGAFARDLEDNQIYDAGANVRRVTNPYEWETIQRYPRTASSMGPAAAFILEGEAGDGGDLLIDDKSEIDFTVGALMNVVSLESDLPQEFSAQAAQGPVTYYITVQVTDGADVDGIDSPDDADLDGIAEPDWDEATVLAEKRIVVLVDTSLPLSDPKRITIFNWSLEGNYEQQ